MRKRILSIILAVLMLVSVLPVTALAAEPTTDPDLAVSTKTSTDPGPKIEKSAKWVDKEKGIAEITFKVTGEQAETSKTKTDIVLVIDRSLSMTQNGSKKLTNAKKAAKKFVNSIMTNDNKDAVRIAVVSYVAVTKDNEGFSNDANTIIKRIDNIKTDYYDQDNGTNIQAGIRSARKLLENSEAAKKVMVVLTDGEPNFSFAFTTTARCKDCERRYDWSCGDFGVKGGTLTDIGPIVESDELADDSDIKSGNVRATITCNTHNRTKTIFRGVYDGNDYKSAEQSTSHSVATIWEANQAKAKNIVIYSIGYEIDTDKEANKIMSAIATDSDKYKIVSKTGTDQEKEDAIVSVFDAIASDLKFKAYDVSLTDTMGPGFTYVDGSASSTDVTVSADGKSLSWEVADKLDENEKNLTFRVKYDTENPSDDALLKTNGKAELKYAEEENGTADKKVGVDSPELSNLARTLTYKDGYSTNGTAGLKDEHAQVRAWYGTEVTVTDVQPTRDGYVFKKWDNAAANDKIKLTDNVTLTAEWDDDTTTVAYEITKEWVKKVGTSATFQIKRDGENYQEVTLTADNVTSGNANVWKKTVNVPKWTAQPNAQGVKTESQYTVEETKINDTALDSNKQVVEKNSDNLATGTWTSTATANGATNTYEPAQTYEVKYDWATDHPDSANLPAGESGLLAGSTYTVTAEGYNDVEDTVNGKTGVWHFEGWEYGDETVSKGSTIPVNGNIEIKGSWTFTENKYKITYVWGDPHPTAATPDDMTNLVQGQEYNVSWPTTTTVVGEKEGVPGTWTFKHWEYNGQTYGENSKVTMGSSDITMTGIWEFTANKKAGVRYTYESGTPGKELPSEIHTLYAVNDTTEYYVGQTVINKGPQTGITYPMDDHSGTWTLTSWRASSDKMVEGGVTFTGTWTFTANKQVTLSYEIVEKAGEPQPADSKKPENQVGYSGTDFTVAGDATTTDTTRAWTFHGWYTDRDCTIPAEAKITLTTDTTLYGYWTSVAIVGNYKVIEYYMQADGTYSDGTEVESSTHALGEWTYPADQTKTGGYTLNETKSELTKTITATETAEFKVYYDLSSGSKVTKVAMVSGIETDEADVGETIDYYITVSNVGGLNLTNLTLTDTFNRADLHFDESENDAYTVTPVDGEEGKWTITIPSLSVTDHEITIHATYKVVDTDSGRTLRNTVVGTDDDTDGGSTVTVGEVTHNNVVINIEKTVTSKRGTAPREGYVFVAYYKDKFDGTEHELGRTTIYMSESATKDDPKTETGKIRFTLSEEEYAQLPREKADEEDEEDEDGTPYLFVKEIPGEDAFTEYDSNVIKGYVVPAPAVNSVSLDEPTYNEVEYIVWPEESLNNVFAFENIYNKPTSRVDPIKVGPQLNRDDHVAYIMGYPDGTVQPEGQITRAEACTIFFRLLTEESRNYYFARSNDYTDVKSTDWYNNAISTLSNAGIVTGYNDGTFRPNQPITRGEMAKIIANFANLNKGAKSFTDLNGHWSKTYVELAAGNGWIAGYPDGTFRPDQKITRAETVTMINRVLERVPARETRLLSRSIMLTFPDNNPGDWYYIAIQEASNSHEYQRSVYEAEGDEMWLRLRDNVDWTKLEK